MITIKSLYDRMNTLTTSGTSGFFTAEDFNSNLYSVQYAVHGLLCDNYENNQKVTDALRNHTLEVNGTTVAGGKMFATSLDTDLEDYYRVLAVNYVDDENVYPTIKINSNEVGTTMSSPIRKANKAIGRTLFYEVTDNLIMLPKEAGTDYNMIYCRKPSLAKIAFTTESTDDNDYLVIDDAETIDLEYPESLFNLFAYLLLESMGVEMRESLASEYSQLGINRTVQTDIN
jgi:hypothetical protein